MISLNTAAALVGSLALASAQVTPPANYKASPLPLGLEPYTRTNFSAFGKTNYTESAHFRVYNSTRDLAAFIIKKLEGERDCFVNSLGWKDPGVSTNNNTKNGPWWKLNVFVTSPLPGALGYMSQDGKTGLSYMVLDAKQVVNSSVVQHEFGHNLNSAYPSWFNSPKAHGWSETIANYVADTYANSPLCADARARANETQGWTMFYPNVVLSYSWMTIIDSNPQTGNDYFAWPFLRYMTDNLDRYAGLGKDIMKKLFSDFQPKTDPTPFHTLARLLNGNTTVQTVVTSYWSRIAFADLNSTAMYSNWYYYGQAGKIDYANLAKAAKAANTYRVIEAKRPRYFGSSIIPLNTTTTTGPGSNNNNSTNATLTVTAPTHFDAVVAIRSTVRDRQPVPVRYVKTAVRKTVAGKGAAQANNVVVREASFVLARGQEARLVVVNAPDKLLSYAAGQEGKPPVSLGLDFTVKMSGVVPAYPVAA